MSKPSEPIEAPELQRRLIFSLLRPVVRLSRRFHLPLKTLEELCRLAYFEEIRRRGEIPQAEVARRFGKSLRTIGSLERRYRSNFFAPEEELEFARRVEERFEEEPSSVEEIAEGLNSSLDEIRRVVESLSAAGRLKESSPARYSIERSFRSLMREDLKARIDGLNHQLDIIAAAVRARFLAPRGNAIARSLSFVAHTEDMEALGDTLIKALREQCGAAEEAALKRGSFQQVGVTLALAPMETDDDR